MEHLNEPGIVGSTQATTHAGCHDLGDVHARVPLLIGAAKLGWEAYLALLQLRRLDEQQARFRNDGDAKYDDVDVYASDN